MKKPVFRAGSDVRALWLFALVTIAAGSFAIARSYETKIAQSRARSEAAYQRTLENERVVHLAGELRASESVAAVDLRRLSRDTRTAQSTADLLSMLQRKAAQFGASVQGVEPSAPMGDGGVPQHLDSRLLETPVTLRVHGTFRGILRFVEQLSQERTLVGVQDVQLSLAGESPNAAGTPQLDAIVHAGLYRLYLPAQEERRVATAR